MKPKIGIGFRIGKLTVSEPTGERKNGYMVWNCTCDCGGAVQLDTRTLQRGTVRDCGCETKVKPGQKNLTGQRFGRLVCLEPSPHRNKQGGTPKVFQLLLRKGAFCRFQQLIAYKFPIEQKVLTQFDECGASVETVCLLVRRNSLHIDIDVDVEEMLQEKRGQATYPQIKEYILEHSGLKVSNLYIAQVKQKCGIIERENYNKPKSEDAKQPQCPLEKEEAIKEALRHFGMI